MPIIGTSKYFQEQGQSYPHYNLASNQYAASILKLEYGYCENRNIMRFIRFDTLLLITLLIPVISLSASQVQSIAQPDSNIDCLTPLSPLANQNPEELMALLFKSNTGLRESYPGINKFFTMAWNSLPFKKYLAQLSIPWREDEPFDKKYALLSDYVHNYISRYYDKESVKRYQNLIMKKFLRNRGVPISTSNTWQEDLKAQSKKNVERIVRELGQPQPVSQDILDAVDSIEIYLVHHSNTVKERISYPLVAPIVLEQMGLEGFAANTHDFSRFMGSHQHVYFYAMFKRKSDYAILTRSQYGDSGVILKEEVAKRLAFISPYIMYKEDLADAAHLVDGDLAHDFVKGNTFWDRGSLHWRGDFADIGDTPELIRQIQRILGRVDFTFEDFESLLKLLAIKRLHDLRTSDPVEFSKYMEALRWGNQGDIDNFLRNEVLKKFGFKNGVEGRVPVAVSPSDLVYFSE